MSADIERIVCGTVFVIGKPREIVVRRVAAVDLLDVAYVLASSERR